MKKSYFVWILAVSAIAIAYFTFTSTTESLNELADTPAQEVNKKQANEANTETFSVSARSSVNNFQNADDEGFKRRININRVGSSSELSLVQIQELGERFKEEEDEGLRREILEELIAGMTKNNALEIRQYIEHMSDKSYEWKEFHKAFGAVAGDVAVLHGKETKGRDIELALVGWVAADPDKAMEWYRALDEKSKKSMFSQERLSMAVLEGLAENDPEVATDFMVNLNAKGESSWRAANILGKKIWKEAVTEGNVDKAIKWVESLPDNDTKLSSQAYIARSYAKMNPLEAASWVEELNQNGQSSRYTVGMVAESWSKTDPEATVNWISGFDADKHRLKGSFYQSFSSWGEIDPHAASTYLQNMDTSKNKDYAIFGLSRTLSSESPEEAMNLASSINDREIRLKSIMNNSRYAFKDNAEGLKTWLSNSSNLSSKEQAKVIKYYNKKKR